MASEKLSLINNSKTLTPEQSQYLSSLTQESQLKKVVTTQPSVVPTFNSHPPGKHIRYINEINENLKFYCVFSGVCFFAF